jgi:hypothetical protein
MTKRRLLLTVGFLAMVAVMGWLALWLNSPRHRINEDTVKLIKNGMTQGDVEAIFGIPPGHYTDGGFYFDHSLHNPPTQDRKEWVGKDVAVDVFFDASGKVLRVDHFRVTRSGNEPFLAKLRRWLRL